MSDTHAPRIDHFAIAGDLFRPMMDQETLLKDSGLEHSLIELVKLRALADQWLRLLPSICTGRTPRRMANRTHAFTC